MSGRTTSSERVATSTLVVPAGEARLFRVAAGQSFEVVSPHGGQVADLWAFCAADPAEFVSASHTRVHLGRLTPGVGDTLVTDRRREALTLVADTSGGAHDLLLPACDRHRYALLGHAGAHRTCADNLREALEQAGLPPAAPQPFNLFERVRLEASGALTIEPPLCPPGGFVQLRAETDLVVVVSACPQDLLPTNGADCRPKPITLRLHPDEPTAASPQSGASASANGASAR